MKLKALNNLNIDSILQGFVSLMGLVSVGGSIFFAYGFCSYFGLAFGPLHNIIPFLLLGIGKSNIFD